MDYNVSHFRSCYIEYNQGQTKWKIKTTPSPHFDDEKLCVSVVAEFIIESGEWVVLLFKLFCSGL